MATFVLPVAADAPNYTFDVQLEGATYRFQFAWNLRDSAWFMSAMDADGNPIVMGRRVVLGTSLLGRSVDPARPPGQIFAIDSSGMNAEPTRDDLGERVYLVYVESTGP